MVTKAKRGRPKKGMDRVIYLRVSDELARRLEAFCAQTESRTGLPVSTSDMVRKILSDALSR